MYTNEKKRLHAAGSHINFKILLMPPSSETVVSCAAKRWSKMVETFQVFSTSKWRGDRFEMMLVVKHTDIKKNEL